MKIEYKGNDEEMTVGKVYQAKEVTLQYFWREGCLEVEDDKGEVKIVYRGEYTVLEI